MATWNKEEIITDDSLRVQAQTPVILSVSRSTDIPAFYADWFLHRLRDKGYSAWTNPFNGIKGYISFKNVRFIVFWSKNPRPLIDTGLLDYLEKQGIKCYVQYTLNNYEEEGLEKGVKPLQYRLDTFKILADKLGPDAVVWRFDPLILTDNITVETLLAKIKYIGDQLKNRTRKLVFSFADILEYTKVKKNLEKNNVPYKLWTDEQMDEFASKLCELKEDSGWNYDLATCGEKIDLVKYGILHNRCIDGDLITRLSWKDKVLMKFMKTEICEIVPNLFEEPTIQKNAIFLDEKHYFISTHKKDPGQRTLCGCMAAKDIGEYNTCIHLCEYCYANTSKDAALRNYENHQRNQFSDTITGR